MPGNDITAAETAIAVIGLSCRVPGAAGAAAYWRNLVSGHSAIARLDDAALATAGVGGRDRNDSQVIDACGEPCTGTKSH